MSHGLNDGGCWRFLGPHNLSSFIIIFAAYKSSNRIYWGLNRSERSNYWKKIEKYWASMNKKAFQSF